MRTLKRITSGYDQSSAWLVGNGPNLNAGIMPSWKELLENAGDMTVQLDIEGLSNTEVYDLVELNSTRGHDVKERVKSLLQIKPSDSLQVHERLMNLARELNVPVLTTNFDEALEKSVQAEIIHLKPKNMTRFYPWESYYGFEKHDLPTDGFGIWKVHGDVRYKDSIRLGLTDYMGSAERARKLIHNGPDRLFQGKRQRYWKGHTTWLHIWFNRPLVIFGLSYEQDEVFLRWLLIERKRYKDYYGDPMEVTFISTGELKPSARNLMQNLGVHIERVTDYAEIYG